jgi:hypothetical protein
MILIHIIRRKKKKKKKRTNFFPTHIKHNSSKIITIMNTSTVLHGFFVQFLSNLRSAKEFLRLIALFSVQFQGTCNRSV